MNTARCKQTLTCLLIANGTHQQQAPFLAAFNAISAPWPYQQDSHCVVVFPVCMAQQLTTVPTIDKALREFGESIKG